MLDQARKSLESAIDRIGGLWIGAQIGSDAIERMHVAEQEVDALEDKARESLGQAELQLSMDDLGWVSLTEKGVQTLIDRATLRRAVGLSRLMFLLNPLIKRAVTVQELYVWGSGCTIKAEAKSVEVQQVLDEFYLDPKNQCVLGTVSSWSEREREQRNDGNVFFLLYQNKSNGTARVRVTSIDEIEDIIYNPEDRNEPWFYKRMTTIDGKETLYPDIDYNPYHKPAKYEGVTIDWKVCVLHSKTGGLPGMKFGLPEFYSVFNWATAYKGILENFATILKAYARIAWKLTGQKGDKGVAASKSRLKTTATSDNVNDTNPPNNTAGWMVMAGNADLSAVKTANSTTGPDEARALRSMVAAGTDTPEHFFGDSDIGNFATSTTLDRPTELKMIARQQMWAVLIGKINTKLVEWSTIAPSGVLSEAGYSYKRTRDKFDGEALIKLIAPKGKSIKVFVEFPVILERNVTDRVRALVQAATLGGRPAEGIFPDRKLLFKLLLKALGEKEADYLTETYYPTEVMQGFVDPADKLNIEREEAEAKTTTAKALQKQAELASIAPKPVKGDTV